MTRVHACAPQFNAPSANAAAGTSRAAETQPTLFQMNVTQSAKASCIVSVPSDYSGSITGACSMTGSIKDDAICLVADASKAKWTIPKHGEELYDHELSEPSHPVEQQYPPAASSVTDEAPAREGEDASKKSKEDLKHSAISFDSVALNGLQDNKGTKQRERRHVTFGQDFQQALDKVVASEGKDKGSFRRFLIGYGIFCICWVIFILWTTSYAEAEFGTTCVLAIMPLALSLIVPLIVISEQAGTLFYKSPTITTGNV